MKTELRLSPHSIADGATAVELWHGGRMIGCIYGADGPGVRIISNHRIRTAWKDLGRPMVFEIHVEEGSR